MELDLKEALVDEIGNHLELINTVQKGSKEQQALVSDLTKLVDSVNELNKTEYEYYDKQERREIDREKNQALAELENKKSELGWKRVTFELAKVVIPSLISIGAYDLFQKRVLKFEETGRLVSTASRELHLPKLPWK